MQASDHLRGALIALVLVGNGIYGLPIPEAASPEEVATGWRQTAGLVLRTLDLVGIEPDPGDVHRSLSYIATKAHTAHEALKVPFSPFFLLTRCGQSWALFAGTGMANDRLVVRVRRGDGARWEDVERRLDPCCTWRDPQFRYRRVRGVWNSQPNEGRPAYANLARWSAREAFAEWEDVVEVRVVVERTYATYPWEPDSPKRDFLHRVAFRRDAPDAWRIAP